MRYYIFLLCTVLALASSPAMASDMQAELRAIPRHILFTSMQQPNETRRVWLVGVAARLSTWTQKTGFEGCGEIGVNKTTKKASIIIATNNAQVDCLLMPNRRLPDTIDSGWSLHSHPVHGCVSFNRIDRRILRAENSPYAFHWHACGNTNRFSSQDISVGPGYLATHNRLLAQDGFDTTVVLDKRLDHTTSHLAAKNKWFFGRWR